MSDAVFVRRTLIVLALTALLFLLWTLRDVLLLVFGAVVFATLFQALAGQYKRIGIKRDGLALALSVLTILAVFGGGVWLFGAQVMSQAEGLSQAVPKAWASLQQRLAGFGIPAPAKLGSGGMFGSLTGNLPGFVMSLGGGLADGLLVVVGGIFIAASPRFYGRGALKLFPAERRELVGDAMADSGRALQLWLKAQLVAMVVIGVLTGVGLWLLGVPGPLALGVLAGLLEFIPFAGPILSALPAILIALAIDPQLALWTVLLYVGIQHIEGYALQPIIQSWAVEIPGAVLLFALLAFGALFGPMGVIFAAPLTVVVFVMVKRLYVQEALDTPTEIPGAQTADG
ncbi:AI-2E family transporter [Sphingomonas sp. KRR8]|uniref:AI-2E family transporter n=1 Tax=Sphingomonas sp. KRR8 TaxID=2942996 RepID=UPI0020222016|nr:AI-2E family transporter [Sphingomonas sp. KRR8]URD61250.1 AI-2E family transporter [Sphingomonas sp. KRR8]